MCRLQGASAPVAPRRGGPAPRSQAIGAPESRAEIYCGLERQLHQQIDGVIVDDPRHFVFRPPGAGGFDLASLNIQRGRTHGVSSETDLREALGLSRHRSFDQITRHRAAQARLKRAFASVDDVDLWVGG